MGARDKQPQQDPRWPTAHLRLQELWRQYREHHPEITQVEFGKKYGIGSQSMVSQYMNAIRPLSIETASKFAKGFGCQIRDISPEMDRWIHGHIFPALGLAAWGRKVGMGFLMAGLLQAVPQPVDAVQQAKTVYYVKSLIRRLVRFVTEPALA